MSIIKKAKKVRVEKEKDPSKNKDVKKVFLLKTEYLIEQTIYDVYVVIKEKKSGHFYYDSGEIKKSTKQDG